jgi:dihydroflavonol-4-reductase
MSSIARHVLVTGASGFIASHVVKQLLAAGHLVRGTVRDPGRAADLAHLRSLPGAAERLALVRAELEPGAFDAHVAGCDAVIHTASPYVLAVRDPQRELVDPALRGTRSVLEACAKAPEVRRVVLTSSMAAVTDEPGERVLTEADWNETSSLGRNPYYFSKTLAEREAWRFVEERHPAFDLVAVNPALVVGPSMTRAVNTSNRVLVDILRGGFPAILDLAWAVVDVRDVAEAHLRAMETPSARGRHLCAAETRTMREVVDLLARSGYAGRVPRLGLDSPFGNRVAHLASWLQPKGIGQYLRTNLGRVPRFDHGKIVRELGLAFRPVDETLLDTVADLARWGHVPPPA